MCTVSYVYPHVPVEEHWHAYVLGHDEAGMIHSSSSQMFAMRKWRNTLGVGEAQ